MIHITLYPLFRISVLNHWELIGKNVGRFKKSLAYRFKHDSSIEKIELEIRKAIVKGLEKEFPSALKQGILEKFKQHEIEAHIEVEIKHFGLIKDHLTFYFKFDLGVQIQNHGAVVTNDLGRNIGSGLALIFFRKRTFSKVEQEIRNQLLEGLLSGLQTKLHTSLSENLKENHVKADIELEILQQKPNPSSQIDELYE